MKKQLTQEQLEYKIKIEDAKKSLQDAKKNLKDTLENCHHCYQFKISKMFCHDDIDVKCLICGEEHHSICEYSPDWQCYYYVDSDGTIDLGNGKKTCPPVSDINGEEITKDYCNDDACIFCGEPEERKYIMSDSIKKNEDNSRLCCNCFSEIEFSIPEIKKRRYSISDNLGTRERGKNSPLPEIKKMNEMHDRAVECAHDNYILSSKIDAYWFPHEDELRMVLLDKTAIPDDGHGKILPFYFTFENKVEAIASILPEEFGKLNVPDGWCDWSEAVHIKE